MLWNYKEKAHDNRYYGFKKKKPIATDIMSLQRKIP